MRQYFPSGSGKVVRFVPGRDGTDVIAAPSLLPPALHQRGLFRSGADETSPLPERRAKLFLHSGFRGENPYLQWPVHYVLFGIEPLEISATVIISHGRRIRARAQASRPASVPKTPTQNGDRRTLRGHRRVGVGNRLDGCDCDLEYSPSLAPYRHFDWRFSFV